DSRNAGARTLTPSGIVNDGNSGNNYSYTFNTATGTINKQAMTITAVTDSKTYDGTTTSSLTPTFGSLQTGDTTTTFPQVFDSRNAGSRTLTPGGIVNDGNSGNNYSYTFNTATGTISKAALTISAVTDSKTYDGTTTSSATPTFGSLQTGDTTTTFSQAFDSRDAGSRTLTPSGIVNDGNS